MITARTRLYAVVGDPVGHSLSPVMHNGWIADFGFDAAYVALRLPAAQAEAVFAALKALDLAGLNITVPLKETAAAAADARAPLVERLAAANTWRREADGRIAAFNTDAPGFTAGLDFAAPGWRGRARTAVVIGAGGAGRAIGFGLAEAGVGRILYVNRTLETAQRAAMATPGGAALAWGELEAAFAEADLIVNATTLGMTGAEACAWPVAALKPDAMVADAVYKPLETELLRAARARGHVVVDGLHMLIHQGALAFELWFGHRPDAAAARARVLAALSAKEQAG